MSKKLTATLVLDLIAGVLAALNAKLSLEIPAEVLATWAGAAGATTVWYLQKQGVLDKAVAGAGAVLLCALMLAGCATTDPLTVQNMQRFKQVWEEDRRPDLDPAKVKAREFEFDQAIEYEQSK